MTKPQGEALKACPFAWTEVSGYKHYPRYINAQAVEGGYRIAVRGAEVPLNCHSGSIREQGPYAEIVIPADEAARLGDALPRLVSEEMVALVRDALENPGKYLDFPNKGRNDWCARAILKSLETQR